jgi:hypothetical protein
MRAGRIARGIAGPLVLLVAIAVVAIVVSNRRDPWPVPVRAANAVGDSTCLTCHAGMSSYERTAHRLTTRHPTVANMEGHFESGRNVLRTTNPALHFVMRADSTGFYQTAVTGTPPDTTMRTERIAYVAGSGRKGQSYLYWQGDQLYQLPISYWRSLDTWIYSPGPGYVEGRAYFERAIAPRCFECHATWIQSRPAVASINDYDSTGAILGITCERCHGSGREHVARERSPLRFVRAPAIVNPARLDRQRNVESCAQCHGGLGSPKVPSFSYIAGKRLDDYLYRPAKDSSAIVDVHGNQAALLARSRCFQQSQMTCLTCHDVHRQERDISVLSGKCLTCHQLGGPTLPATHGKEMVGRCVSCHMPLQKSNLIVSALGKEEEQVEVRSHWIKVYKDSLQR